MLDEIDSLLWDWWRWQDSYAPALGYPQASASCRDYRPRYRDFEDDIDTLALRTVGEAVDRAVDRLPAPCRVAIHTEMRNRAVGVAVWSSARPATSYDDALHALAPLLRASGLLDTSEKMTEHSFRRAEFARRK